MVYRMESAARAEVSLLGYTRTEAYYAETGGTGIDLKSQLSHEIEDMCPDYMLYPKINYSIGFTSR